jgi:hypothetical protein
MSIDRAEETSDAAGARMTFSAELFLGLLLGLFVSPVISTLWLEAKARARLGRLLEDVDRDDDGPEALH